MKILVATAMVFFCSISVAETPVKQKSLWSKMNHDAILTNIGKKCEAGAKATGEERDLRRCELPTIMAFGALNALDRTGRATDWLWALCGGKVSLLDEHYYPVWEQCMKTAVSVCDPSSGYGTANEKATRECVAAIDSWKWLNRKF